MSGKERTGKPVRIARCPQCGQSTRLDPSNPWRPFCSERCKLVDLGAWFGGERSIPGEPTGPGENDQSDQ